MRTARHGSTRLDDPDQARRDPLGLDVPARHLDRLRFGQNELDDGGGIEVGKGRHRGSSSRISCRISESGRPGIDGIGGSVRWSNLAGVIAPLGLEKRRPGQCSGADRLQAGHGPSVIGDLEALAGLDALEVNAQVLPQLADPDAVGRDAIAHVARRSTIRASRPLEHRLDLTREPDDEAAPARLHSEAMDLHVIGPLASPAERAAVDAVLGPAGVRLAGRRARHRASRATSPAAVTRHDPDATS